MELAIAYIDPVNARQSGALLAYDEAARVVFANLPEGVNLQAKLTSHDGLRLLAAPAPIVNGTAVLNTDTVEVYKLFSYPACPLPSRRGNEVYGLNTFPRVKVNVLLTVTNGNGDRIMAIPVWLHPSARSNIPQTTQLRGALMCPTDIVCYIGALTRPVEVEESEASGSEGSEASESEASESSETVVDVPIEDIRPGMMILPYNFTATGWSIYSPDEGSCRLDVRVAPYGTVPDEEDSVVGAVAPELVFGANFAASTDLSGWTNTSWALRQVVSVVALEASYIRTGGIFILEGLVPAVARTV